MVSLKIFSLFNYHRLSCETAHLTSFLFISHLFFFLVFMKQPCQPAIGEWLFDKACLVFGFLLFTQPCSWKGDIVRSTCSGNYSLSLARDMPNPSSWINSLIFKQGLLGENRTAKVFEGVFLQAEGTKAEAMSLTV